MGKLVTLFVNALALAAVLTPVARALALRWGAIDAPAARRINAKPTPRLGGLALLPAIVVGLWLTSGAAVGSTPSARAVSLIAGAVIVTFLGAYDDIFALRARSKLLIVTAAAAVVWWGGFRLTALPVPFAGTQEIGIWGLPLTLLWITAVTNAINLLDGLDGLAAGVSAIAAIGLAYLAQLGDAGSLLVMTAVALAGACAGFLIHNRHPARVFLGDAGSLLIGFLLACLSLGVAQSGVGSGTLLLPALVLGVPLVDMVVCFFRRLAMGRSPFGGDCGHVHHLLLATGLPQPQAVRRLYGTTIVLGACAIWLAHMKGIGTAYVIAALALLTVLFYRRFGYFSWAFLRQGRRWNAIVSRAMPEPGDAEIQQSNREAAAGVGAVAGALGLDYVRIDARDPIDGAPRTVLETGDKSCRRRAYGLNVGSERLVVTLGNGERDHRLYTRHLILTPLLEGISETLGNREAMQGIEPPARWSRRRPIMPLSDSL